MGKETHRRRKKTMTTTTIKENYGFTWNEVWWTLWFQFYHIPVKWKKTKKSTQFFVRLYNFAFISLLRTDKTWMDKNISSKSRSVVCLVHCIRTSWKVKFLFFYFLSVFYKKKIEHNEHMQCPQSEFGMRHIFCSTNS